MRIALAGISHETNTYCAGQTDLADFHAYRGKKILATSGQESDVGGAVDACVRLGCEPVPIFFATCQPSGVIAREAYAAMKQEVLDNLVDAGPVDGCVLLLHGAGVVDGIHDLEGDLAGAVRELLGDVPIAASFDLHGNITQAMADQLNGIFACHHYPHVDLHERAAEAVACVIDMAGSGRRARCEVIQLPILQPTTTTYEGIGKEMLAQLLALEAECDCLDLSWFHGFPYTDVPHVGSFVAASYYPDENEPTSKKPSQQASAIDRARQFAEELWHRREEFRAVSLDGNEAIESARSHTTYPVVIHETSDNCGGGSPGDGTHLLRAMLDADLGSDACFAFVVDAEIAAQAHSAGVGSHIEISLGGKTDELHGTPIVTSAYVKALHDGRLIMQHMFRGSPLNLGPLARLVIDGIDVVVGSRRNQTFDQEPFLAVGIDVMKYKYVALKSSNHFRAGFQAIASAIVTADTPGLTTHQIERFPRQHTQRRLWPVDEHAEFPEQDQF